MTQETKTPPVQPGVDILERAREDGRTMGRALGSRPAAEQRAWLAGVGEVLGLALTPDYRGLPEPPAGWQWAEAGDHVLQGSEGLAHLIPAGPSGTARPTSVCAMDTTAWIRVGRWESTRREACPQCAGQRTTS